MSGPREGGSRFAEGGARPRRAASVAAADLSASGSSPPSSSRRSARRSIALARSVPAHQVGGRVRGPRPARRVPLTAICSPLSARRFPRTACRSPHAAGRLPPTVRRTPRPARRGPFTPPGSALAHVVPATTPPSAALPATREAASARGVRVLVERRTHRSGRVALGPELRHHRPQPIGGLARHDRADVAAALRRRAACRVLATRSIERRRARQRHDVVVARTRARAPGT